MPSLKPRFRPTPSTTSTTTTPADLESDRAAYIASQRSTIDARRAVGLFRGLRRTGEELDLRAGVQGNVMWRDEEQEIREEEKAVRRRRLEGMGDEEEEVGGSRRGRGRGKGVLDYAEGVSSTVVDTSDSDDEDEVSAAKEEEQAWFAQPIPERLALAQAYLREKYYYCQWCGVQYEGREDLEGNCPGVEEEDH